MKVYTPKGYSNLTVVSVPADEIAGVGFGLCAQPRQTVDAWYKAQDDRPEVVSNAGFFDMTSGNAVGTVIVGHCTMSVSSRVREGIGTVDGKRLLFGHSVEHRWKDFVAGYPVLIRAGRREPVTLAKEINYRTRRTCLGFDAEGTVHLLCVDSPGMAFGGLQTLLLKLGCVYAINLDGGGSTRLLIKGARKTRQTANRPVDTVFYIKLKFRPWTGAVTRSVLNVRSGPGPQHTLLRVLPKGTQVAVQREENGWGLIGDGWVHLGYVRRQA